jgi:hypothetical protein
MRSTLSRRLLPVILFLPLLLTSCGTVSTRPSLARTERPTLPPLPAELRKTERLAPLTAKPSGQLVTVDRSILTELAERFMEAIGAIERGNQRAVATNQERECQRAILATGAAPKGC